MNLPGLQLRTPIGIDIGAGRIKAAQLARAGSGWRLAGSLVLDRSGVNPIPTQDEIDLLAGLIFEGDFHGTAVVVGAPRDHLHTTVLELPPRTSGAPVEQLCAAECARAFRLAPGSYEMHAWEIPTASERASATQMSVSALEATDAERVVAPFDAAGLVVEAIDLAGEAILRACAPACQEIPEITAVLDIGQSGVDLVTYREGRPVYQRWLADRGTGRIGEAIARSLALDETAAQLLLRRVGLRGFEAAEADPVAVARLTSLTREYTEQLLHQVFGSVVYMLDRFPGESITHLRLAGGGAAVPELDHYLAELSGLDVKCIGPSDCAVACPPDRDRPELLAAIGHAQWRAG